MAKGKILIIEDDRDIVEMVEYNLKEEGFDTIAALNGPDGIKLSKREHPDLIILDIMLPVIDGFELYSGSFNNLDKLFCLFGIK